MLRHRHSGSLLHTTTRDRPSGQKRATRPSHEIRVTDAVHTMSVTTTAAGTRAHSTTTMHRPVTAAAILDFPPIGSVVAATVLAGLLAGMARVRARISTRTSGGRCFCEGERVESR